MKRIIQKTFILLALCVTATALLLIDTASFSHAQTDPISFVGRWGGAGATEAVFVDDNIAYIGQGDQMTILDVSDPAVPLTLGQINRLPDVVRDIKVISNTAYVLSGFAESGPYSSSDDHLSIIDVSDPTMPVTLGGVSVYSHANGSQEIEVVGNIVYIASGLNGLNAVDVSDPTNPVSVATPSSLNFYANVWGMQVTDGIAYVAGSSLATIDVNDSTNSVLLDQVMLNLNIVDVQVVENIAYLLVEIDPFVLDLVLVDVSDPTDLIELGSVTFGDTYEDGLPPSFDIQVIDDTAFIAGVNNNLVLADVSDPANPAVISTADTGGLAHDVHVVGDIAYVADGNTGLVVLDVTDLITPTQLATITTPFVADVQTVGNIAYIAAGSQGLQLLNVSDPAQPTAISALDLGGDASRVYVEQNIAYLMLDNGQSWVTVDVTDSAALTLIGSIDVPRYSPQWHTLSRSEVVGDIAYYIRGDIGLDSSFQVDDISDPTTSVQLASLNTFEMASDVAVFGDRAYVSDFTGVLNTFDVSDPATPVRIDYSTTIVSAPLFVEAAHGLLYILDQDMRVFDVSRPDDMTDVQTLGLSGNPHGIYIDEQLVYVASGSGGLTIFENTTSPTSVSFHTAGTVPVLSSAVVTLIVLFAATICIAWRKSVQPVR